MERAVSSETLLVPPPKKVEYVVDKIVGHSVPTIDKQCTVRCYMLAPEDDTVEAAPHMPKHLITRYWGRIRHKQT